MKKQADDSATEAERVYRFFMECVPDIIRGYEGETLEMRVQLVLSGPEEDHGVVCCVATSLSQDDRTSRDCVLDGIALALASLQHVHDHRAEEETV